MVLFSLISLLRPVKILLLFWGVPKDTLLCLCMCAEHVLQCCEAMLGVLRHGDCGLGFSGRDVTPKPMRKDACQLRCERLSEI